MAKTAFVAATLDAFYMAHALSRSPHARRRRVAKRRWIFVSLPDGRPDET